MMRAALIALLVGMVAVTTAHPVQPYPNYQAGTPYDLNNDGVPDGLDRNLDGKPDYGYGYGYARLHGYRYRHGYRHGGVVVYPNYQAGTPYDLNNDGVPDGLDRNLDGKVDYYGRHY
ncbi:unnamed protein product [Owenia fusiformis]|uniref:Uncharacterized protein n=1 Tax=Owenia fusiformis TaxID=6347 RepID=A0A8J1TB42_OWEFU|nr:unnamed protein product [Owenia fusiformis]